MNESKRAINMKKILVGARINENMYNSVARMFQTSQATDTIIRAFSFVESYSNNITELRRRLIMTANNMKELRHQLETLRVERDRLQHVVSRLQSECMTLRKAVNSAEFGRNRQQRSINQQVLTSDNKVSVNNSGVNSVDKAISVSGKTVNNPHVRSIPNANRRLNIYRRRRMRYGESQIGKGDDVSNSQGTSL